ncbi:hypothetical protein GGR56DRAFT_553739 [Xylariaceae sp. FL0804]|nr:hypothetical protein GGR56DRAFT_553739 [Xylariaceae sp. FL0804]
MAMAKRRNPFVFGTGRWDPTHRYETSWLLPPYALFALRALMSLYGFTVLFFNIGYECAHPGDASVGGCAAARQSFSYFTVLTYWGLAFYNLVAAVHTFTYARSRGANVLLDRLPRPLQALHALLHTTVTVYPFLVTIVYWGVLYPYGAAWFPTTYGAWANVSEHAVNSLFALLELLLSRTPPAPWPHAAFVVLLLALYCALAYLTHAVQGWYTYSFLDPDVVGKGGVVAYVFAIAAGILVIFVAVHFAAAARLWLVERRLGRTGCFAPGDPAAAIAEAEGGRRGRERGRGRREGDVELGSRHGSPVAMVQKPAAPAA